MIAAILGIPGKLKLWALAFAGAVVAALGIYAKGRSDAKAKAETRGLKDTIKAHEARNEADDSANADPDPKRRLRDDWSR